LFGQIQALLHRFSPRGKALRYITSGRRFSRCGYSQHHCQNGNYSSHDFAPQ
jgi:hypothetical protein